MTRLNYRLRLSCVGDDFVLGIMCGKLDIVDIAMNQLGVSRNEERRRLFNLGLNEHGEHSFSELARELYKSYKIRPDIFDEKIKPRVGDAVYSEIMAIIEGYNPKEAKKKDDLLDDLIADIIKHH